jgi:ribose transport system substrate-binding protein
MKNRKITKTISVLLCAIAASTAFLPATFAQSKDKPLNLAFLTNNPSDFWTIARAGCDQAQKELPNVKVEFKMPADGTAAEQTRIFDDLLVKGIDGIALSPVDPANQTAMIDKGTEKALIITQDSDAPKSKRSFYVGTDNVAAGRQAGELIKKAIPQGGKIMMFVGKRDAQNAKERIQGIEETLKGSNVQIIDVRADDTDRVRAKQNVADTLVKYPDIACLVGLWSYNGPAIINATKDAGKIGKVKLVLFDEENDTLQGVKDGAVEATVVQNPYEFGRQAVTLMAKKLRGEDLTIPESKAFIVPTRAIDKSNVDEFWANLKKLRGH